MNTAPNPTPTLLRVDAHAAIDDRHTHLAPAAALIALQPDAAPTLIAIDHPAHIDTHPASPHADRLHRPNAILTPGHANAHTHLDLTYIGPQPHEPGSGFVRWIDMVRQRRCTQPSDIAAAVEQGITLLRKGGVVAVGDIAGAPAGRPCLVPLDALARSGLWGITYLEFFAIGTSMHASLRAIDTALDTLPALRPTLKPGLQPHATNTVDRRAYQWAVGRARRAAMPLATHLAETLDERHFIAHAKGPQRDLLERLGLWDDSVLDHIGRGLTPVAHLAPILREAADSGVPVLAAHASDLTDRDIDLLARAAVTVAYCPRAHAYFGSPALIGPHRYRDLLDAGVRVCLGTDSIINLPPRDVERAGLGVLPDLALLWNRDRTPLRTLIAMATTHPALALGLDPDHFRFRPGQPLAGLVAITPSQPTSSAATHPESILAAALEADPVPELILDASSRLWINPAMEPNRLPPP